MEKQSRRDFIKANGAVLLVTTGISVFGVFTANAHPADEGHGGYYDDGYYDDGYYNDGYSTGITELNSDLLTLQVFPNPSDGNFTLLLTVKSNVNSDIIIHDMTGKALVSGNHDLREGENMIPFQSTGLARGIYILSVVTANGSDSLRIVIAK